MAKYCIQLIRSIKLSTTICYVALFTLLYSVQTLQPYFISSLIGSSLGEITYYAAGIAASLLIPVIASYPSNYMLQKIRMTAKSIIVSELMKKDYAYYMKNDVSSIQQLVEEISFSSRAIFNDAILPLFNSIVLLVVSTILLGRTNIIVGLLFLVFMTAYAFLSFKLLKGNGSNITSVIDTSTQVKATLLDCYNNIDSIIIHDAQEYESGIIGNSLKHERNAYYALQHKINKANTILQCCLLLFIIAVFGFIVFSASGSYATITETLLVLVYTLINFSGTGKNILTFVEFRDRLKTALDKTGLYKEDNDAIGSEYRELVPLKENESIKVSSLTYGYGTPLKSNLSFYIPYQKNSLISGKNGTGKSSLIKVIAGLLTPMSGEISINNTYYGNIADSFGYYTQSTMLFNRSILDNIVYPHNERVDPERIMNIIHEVRLDELVPSEEHLNSIISGDMGKRFSGGEKQKIILARAIYEQKDIVLFDEITASMDASMKNHFYELLDEYFRDKTVICISHEEDAASHFDHIVEIKPDTHNL